MDTSFSFFIKAKRQIMTPPHRHDFLEFTLVVEGRGEEKINGISHPMEPGTLVLLLPYQVHEIKSDPGHPLLLYICNFSMELLLDHTVSEKGLFALLQFGEEISPYVNLSHEQMKVMKPIFEQMIAENGSSELWKHMVMKAKLVEALSLFDRYRRKTQGIWDGKLPIPSGNHKDVWAVVRHIHQHYRQQMTLADLAQIFHFHPAHLSESFKKHLGINLLHFIHELRIRYVCSLLHSTELSISEISVESGFGSLPTFMRIFRDHKKMTPSEYRKSRKGNASQEVKKTPGEFSNRDSSPKSANE